MGEGRDSCLYAVGPVCPIDRQGMLLKKAIFLVLILTMALVLLATRGRYLLAAAYRNTGNYQLYAALPVDAADCSQYPDDLPVHSLQIANRLEPDDPINWGSLAWISGIQEREWLVEQLQDQPGEGSKGDISQWISSNTTIASAFLLQNSKCGKLGRAWRAFNLGLVEASNQNWHDAVAAYQLGIGLIPGNVPGQILQEYYTALAYYYLEDEGAGSSKQLAAAKYLALGGNSDEAKRLLEEIGKSGTLTGDRTADLQTWYGWLIASAGGPIFPDMQGYADQSDSPGGDPDLEWKITQSAGTTIGGATLLGFDLDQDVLAAGAEALGVLYWQSSEGSVHIEPFRQPNLWPNSGSNWIQYRGFWECLPGYIEPGWVGECASEGVWLGGKLGEPASHLVIPDGDGPDTYIESYGSDIMAGAYYVYGGIWRLRGDFANPYIARRYINSDETLYVDPVIDLSKLPQGVWQQEAALIEPLEMDAESVIWVRPRSGAGSGELYFQDAFSFALLFP